MGTLNTRCRKYNRDPKRDHNFDNHPCMSKASAAAISANRALGHRAFRLHFWGSWHTTPLHSGHYGFMSQTYTKNLTAFLVERRIRFVESLQNPYTCLLTFWYPGFMEPSCSALGSASFLNRTCPKSLGNSGFRTSGPTATVG